MYTAAGPSQVVTGTLPLSPLSIMRIGSLASCSAAGRLDLGDLGIIEQQLNKAQIQLGSQALPSCDAL